MVAVICSGAWHEVSIQVVPAQHNAVTFHQSQKPHFAAAPSLHAATSEYECGLALELLTIGDYEYLESGNMKIIVIEYLYLFSS